MEIENLHRRNERITVRWPGGPYDFVLLFHRAEAVNAPGWDDWIVLHGFVISPEGPEHRAMRHFYAHPTGDHEYALLPLVVG